MKVLLSTGPTPSCLFENNHQAVQVWPFFSVFLHTKIKINHCMFVGNGRLLDVLFMFCDKQMINVVFA